MSVSRSYAGALYSALKAEGAEELDLKKAEADLELFAVTLGTHKELRAILSGPSASGNEKQAVIQALKDRLSWSPIFFRFVSLIQKKGRIALVSDISAAFKRVRIESSGGTLGLLESAEPLSEEDIQQLSAAFARRLGKGVAFEQKTKPELLAGVRLTVAGTTYDGTLRAQLNRLREKFFGEKFLTH